MSWRQPLCDACWKLECHKRGEPAREPTRSACATEETCCMCAVKTQSGIFVRLDPHKIPFPKRDDFE